MKILVIGKGAVGGYFGGRLQQAGLDVTYLVRKKADELKVQSVHGNMDLSIKTLLAGEQAGPFDVILVSTKAYHLAQALADFAPYVGEETLILPLMNGIRQVELLQQQFPSQVLGGICFIESTLDQNGVVIQTSKRHDIVFGELSGMETDRVRRIHDAFSQAGFKTILTEDIRTAMWNKFVFISGLSGITTLMYSAIGPIQESPYGTSLFKQLLQEITMIANAEGISVFEPEKNLDIAFAMGASMKASMLRDMEKGMSIEADHLQGHLLELADKHSLDAPLLRIAYNRLKVYELNLG